jgi:hypothetical protein
VASYATEHQASFQRLATVPASHTPLACPAVTPFGLVPSMQQDGGGIRRADRGLPVMCVRLAPTILPKSSLPERVKVKLAHVSNVD